MATLGESTTPGIPQAIDILLGANSLRMPEEFAQDLVNLRAPKEVQARIDELAERCNEGTLTDSERVEYEGYVHAIHLIGVLQARARVALASGPTH